MVQLAFINEHSRPTAQLSDRQSAATIDALVEVLIAARKHIPRLAAVSDEPLLKWQVGASYSIARWLNEAPKDRKRFLLSLTQLAPFRAISDVADDLDMDAHECSFRGQPFDGLSLVGIGLAHLYGTFAVSFDANPQWVMSMVPINSIQMDDNGGIETREASVIHATTPAHIDFHALALKTILRKEASSPAELWANKDQYFSNLRFLDKVQEDIRSLPKHAFRQVTSWLFNLDACLEGWDPADTPVPHLPPHTTNESATRKPFFELHYRGAVHSFSMHGRYTPGAGRIHFSIVGAERMCVIGYIGQKVNSKLSR